MKHDNKRLSAKEFLLDALDRYEQKLTHYAARMYGGDLNNARDAVQHTFLKLCQQPLSKVEHKLAPWLYTVCRNRVLDDMKTRKRVSTFDWTDFDRVDEQAHDPACEFERSEILLHLQALIRQLRDMEREVIELWSQGFVAREIADILGCPSGTVRVNLHRAIKKLQKNPEVSSWLERATGQVVGPDARRNGRAVASKRNAKAASTISGDRS